MKTLKKLLNESKCDDISSLSSIAANYIKEFQMSDVFTLDFTKTQYFLKALYGYTSAELKSATNSSGYKFLDNEEKKTVNILCNKLYKHPRMKQYFEFGKWNADDVKRDYDKFKDEILTPSEQKRLDFLAEKIKK